MDVGKFIFLTVLLMQIGNGSGQGLAGSGGQMIGTISKLVSSFNSNSSQIQNAMDIIKDPGAFMKTMANSGQALGTVMKLRNLTDGIGADCMEHMVVFMQGLYGQEDWALRNEPKGANILVDPDQMAPIGAVCAVIDAIGKPPSGLMGYKLLWIGDWEECVGTKAVVSKNVSHTVLNSNPFSGKYCPVSFPLNIPGMFGQQYSLTIGTCFPDSCSSADTETLLKLLIAFLPSNISKSVPEPKVKCQENNLELDGRAIAVIVVCVIFAAIMTIATTYDVIYVNWLANPSPRQTHVNGIEQDGLKSPDVYVVKTTLTEKADYENGKKTDVPAVAEPETSSSEPQKTPKYKPGMIENVLLSFSVFTNGTKLLNTHQPKGALTAVNGIRFLSMTWVIIGHGFDYIVRPPTENSVAYIVDLGKRKAFTPIINGTFSVDTFFLLSGLLVSYLSLKELKKVNGVKGFKWVMFYFHRFWRLTPPYMLLLMMWVSFAKYFGNGPLWSQDGFDGEACQTEWWMNLLYINNLVKGKQTMGCFGWTWYLANDMQFYVLSPLLLIPLFYSPILGGLACLLTLTSSVVGTGLISMHYKLPSPVTFGDDNEDFMWQYYVKPWCRVGPYIVGMFTGYMLYRSELKMKINKFVNLVLWFVAIALGCLIIYGLYTDDFKDPLTVKQAAAYNALARSLWGVCVAWVVFSCANGYGGPINHILSWSAFVPLGRLTYLAYLVHLPLMSIFVGSARSTFSAYDYVAIYQMLGHICMAYAAAFVLSLAFEAPMMGLEKTLLGRGKNS